MPRTSERGGPQTRAKILEVSTRMFVERGYDAVTVKEIASEAGVSSVTVFNHFPRKEDLFLDRSFDAGELLRATVRERDPALSVLDALRAMCLRLVDERNALSGVTLDPRSIPFFRTVAESPALVSRARGIGAELQRILADELDADPAYDGNGELLAAFFIAGYASVLVESARRQLAGESGADVVAGHRARLEQLFVALAGGVA